MGRGTETEDVIRKRLSRAVEEAQGIENYDYIVVNDELEKCVEDIHAIVIASHCKVQKSIVRIEKTEDGGKTWFSVHETSDNYIQIHNGARVCFYR